MGREKKAERAIGILATGDEICHGDIVNSNSQNIAERLVKQGMEVRLHMVAPDTENEIESALRFLLQSHDAVIITGGLGPTSDDLTRFAVGKVLDQPLIFNETMWQQICDRLKRFGYDTPPESNRQQALFPEKATIIPNPNGTAAGAFAQKDKQWIFMLPGPPNECLPMLDTVVIPTLKEANFSRVSFHRHWFLFGVSEGKIAEELDLLADPYDCVTGYRLLYPYIEFKIYSNQQKDFDTVVALVEKAVKPYLVGEGQQTALQAFKERLLTTRSSFHISDEATGGAFEAAITTPETRKHLHFAPTHSQGIQVKIQGLNAYWEGQSETNQTSLTLIITDHHQEYKTETSIPFRGRRVLLYAIELICMKLIDFIPLVKN